MVLLIFSEIFYPSCCLNKSSIRITDSHFILSVQTNKNSKRSEHLAGAGSKTFAMGDVTHAQSSSIWCKQQGIESEAAWEQRMTDGEHTFTNTGRQRQESYAAICGQRYLLQLGSERSPKPVF